MTTGTINYGCYIKATKGIQSPSRQPNNVELDWDGEYFATTKDINDTYSPLEISVNIVNLGLSLFRNVGTSDIYLSFDGGLTTSIIIVPDGFALLPLNPSLSITDIKAKTITGTSRLDYTIFSTDLS